MSEDNSEIDSSACAECGELLDPDAKFCAHCGTPVVVSDASTEPIAAQIDAVDPSPWVAIRTCTQCGAAVADGLRFCTSCGAPQPELVADPLRDSGPVSTTAVASEPAPAATVPVGDHENSNAARISIIAAGVAVIVIAVIASSGSDDNSSSRRASAKARVATPKTEPPSTIPPTTTALPTSLGYNLSGSDTRGYSQTVTVSFREPVKVDPTATESVMRNGKLVQEKTIKACPVNASTDAMVEVTLTFRNTTANFPEVLGMNLTQANPSSSGFQVASDTYYSDSGPTCTTPSSTNSYKLYGVLLGSTTVANGADTATFVLILHNYYTPASPAGDLFSYKAIRLVPELTFGSSSDIRRARPTITNASNPAIPAPQVAPS